MLIPAGRVTLEGVHGRCPGGIVPHGATGRLLRASAGGVRPGELFLA
ncbi:hypothetical protein [Hallella colorans]|nr:hypothetical protein [Hallella colorans]